MANALDPRLPVLAPYCCAECAYWDEQTAPTDDYTDMEEEI